MNNTPLLEGYGVRLEPMSLHHLPGLVDVAIEPSIWRYMMPRIETPADVRLWVEESLQLADGGRVQPWVSVVEGRVAGSTRLLDLDLSHRTTELGFTWIAPAFRGTGLNPRVKLLQLTYAFETLALRRVAFKTHHENIASQNAMLKLGLQYEGTFRNHMIMRDGSTRHSRWYSAIADEWPALKASLLQRLAQQPLSVPA